MSNGNGNYGAVFTFAVIIRGDLRKINTLIDFLKDNNFVIAHQKIGQQKMWIKGGEP